ncbi:Potassium channel subfamily K member 13 [Acipenser ruthenus]|uniref:Potassium channel subfamily K member 13 n=1 Tax=Acipenser ruthenus TaxID=7906 RepID=A0A444TX19_ACIRT|nr:potassium channel subfamily K member 13 [Acipenser ruthenus]RXM27484.1 Potassium channel subfamily K member 13 [Acipenser ruthenus]
MARRGDEGCCAVLRLNEDNARFGLLAMLILLYLLCGALVFSAIEQPTELKAKKLWTQRLRNFTEMHSISGEDLKAFLRTYEEANVYGIHVDKLRPRWDFPGAFYFVGTVVSTIGFGMTTPATIGGKIFLIFYGLIGCAATILFFNLFLERIITMLAYIMRWFHERQLRCTGVLMPSDHRCGSGTSGGESDSLEGWKPSVYYVMLILGVAALLIACCASAMYTVMEEWGYFESLYFCFVAFSTIGFGDLVSGQKEYYVNQGAYRFGNCLFILMGVCCIYSLFNVISIIIKQTLNWILKKLDCRCCRRCTRKHLRHRNAVNPAHINSRRNDVSVDTVCDSETDGRRMSGEMISAKDFLASNKVSLAIMQKQLYETANGGPRQSYVRHNGFSGGIGALAVMNNRLAETSVDR